jgi:hypothetical protein
MKHQNFATTAIKSSKYSVLNKKITRQESVCSSILLGDTSTAKRVDLHFKLAVKELIH